MPIRRKPSGWALWCRSWSAPANRADSQRTETSGGELFNVHQVRAYGELNGGGQVLKIKTVGGAIVIRKLTEELQKQHELLKEHEGRLQWLKERIKLRRAPKPPAPPPPPEPNR